jgi:hypothetical protein
MPTTYCIAHPFIITVTLHQFRQSKASRVVDPVRIILAW